MFVQTFSLDDSVRVIISRSKRSLCLKGQNYFRPQLLFPGLGLEHLSAFACSYSKDLGLQFSY